MKKILLVALLLIPFFGFSQTTKPIEGFLGVKFHTPKAQVIAALKAKGGIVYKDTVDMVAFTGLKLGHFDTDIVIIYFIDNKAYEARFGFSIDPEDKTIDYYKNIASQINEIYGPGKESKVFRTPFKDGDGYEITAIKEGDADYKTIWENGDNSIDINISTDLSIGLRYQDNILVKEAIARQKSKEKGDF